MSNRERVNQWQNHINQWQESGLSGARFCKRRELDLAQFYHMGLPHGATLLAFPSTVVIAKLR